MHTVELRAQVCRRLQNPCNPARPLQESPGPPGPESRKSLKRVSRGLPAPESKKCPKQSRNSLRSLKTVYFESPETVSRLFRTLFGPRDREALGDSFETLSGFWARRARETPVRGGRGCNKTPGLETGTLGFISCHPPSPPPKKTPPKPPKNPSPPVWECLGVHSIVERFVLGYRADHPNKKKLEK